MANPSPSSIWAQQQAPPPPDIPSVWAASVDPQMAATMAAMPDKPKSAVPDLWAPSTPAPNVTLAKAPLTPEQQQIARDQQKLQKVEWAQDNPWGTANNHPGKLGKLAHVFSTLGNVAGEVFAPHITAAIPGTQLNRDVQEDTLAKRLNTETNSEADQEHLGAETAKTQQDTSLEPGKTQSEENLQGAQAGEAKARTGAIENPQATNVDLATYRSLTGLGMSPSDALKEIERDKALGLAPKGMEHVDLTGPDGKPMGANYSPATGTYTDSAGKVIDNPVPYQKPNQAGMITMIAPDPNTPGGGIVERLGAGAHIAPGSQTTAGVNSMNTPTTNQRTAAGRAETVLSMVPEVTSRIDATASQMGPEMGRWNDFMQGKIGTDNPQFAALRSDLLMMSSAVALAHAQGRLPENLREEFDKAINAPKQTPANLKATINAMVPWLQKVQSQGEHTGTQSQNGAPKEGDVKMNGAGDKIKFSGGKWVAQ